MPAELQEVCETTCNSNTVILMDCICFGTDSFRCSVVLITWLEIKILGDGQKLSR